MTYEHYQLERARRAVLLSGRDWVYLLSLLIPFVVCGLALKGLLIVSTRRDPVTDQALELMQIRPPAAQPLGLLQGLGLLQSDLLFSLGYVLLWSGLFALAQTGLLRWIVVLLFHALTLCIALVNAIAYQYFRATGSSLDFDTLLLGLAAFTELRSLIASEVSAGILLLVLLVLGYSLFGPLLVTTVVGWRRGWLNRKPLGQLSSWRHSAGVLLPCLACVLWALALQPGSSTTSVSKSLARNAFVNVLLTAADRLPDEELPVVVGDLTAVRLPSAAQLQPTATTRRRNVVLIALESTRASATTPYNQKLATTPFLNALAQNSLLVEQAYAIIPHTHSALTAINCGIYPPIDARSTRLLAERGTIPAICLPHLLRAQGYHTVYFMSQVKTFENSQQILQNLGYQDFYSLENMDTTGFERTNYFGVEDEVMLAPTRAWLERHRDRPFLAAYLTSAPHHNYLAPSRRHGRVAFTANDTVNRYLNCVRNQDFFLKQLFDLYRELGLYDDTIFILIGDHGQGFGEHGRNAHDNNIYEEGLRIPLLIHDPQRFKHGTRLAGPVSQLDILPTVVDMLGYQLVGEGYNGSSILRPLRKDRTFMFICAGEKGCMASLKGSEKYIYHFDDRPDELFDLAADPAEWTNLAGERAPEELLRRRSELIAWRANVQAMYRGLPAE